MSLTTEQQRFCARYLIYMDATSAAKEAGYVKNAAPPETGYYTYALLCPIQNDLFYVGKGQKNRVFQHKNQSGNRFKVERVAAIKKAGLDIEYLILSKHESEIAAYEAENDLMAAIGYQNLTNIAPAEAKRNRKLGRNRGGWRFLEPMDSFDGVQEWAIRSLELLRPYIGQRRILFLNQVMSPENEEKWISILKDIEENGWVDDEVEHEKIITG